MNACARLLPGVPVSRPSISGADSDWTSRMRRSASMRPVSRGRADCAEGAAAVSTRTTAHHDARLNDASDCSLGPPSHWAGMRGSAFALAGQAHAQRPLPRTSGQRTQRTSGSETGRRRLTGPFLMRATENAPLFATLLAGRTDRRHAKSLAVLAAAAARGRRSGGSGLPAGRRASWTRGCRRRAAARTGVVPVTSTFWPTCCCRLISPPVRR